jgi:predicted ribosomally synthesized peptide with nif11-like leader
MSAEGATALFERLNADEQFRAQVETAETPDDKRRIVTEAGYDVNREDLPTIQNLAGPTELSDEDLNKIAGGTGDTTSVVTAVGASVSFVAAAAGVV